jgi:hypothetical protein
MVLEVRMEKYLSHNGNLIYRGANKLIYRNYEPPAPNIDGIVFRIELNENQNSNIGFNAVSVDGVPIHSGEIYKGRHYAYGTWTDIPAGTLEGLVTGQSTVFCNTLELWIAEHYASSLSFSTLSWLQPLYANVYVDEYVNPDTITGELVNIMNILNPGVEYTYNW